MSIPSEATVTIDGVTLTTAQTLTLRVALSSFLVDIGRGDDGDAILDPANGGAIYRLYAEHGRAVEQMLVDGANATRLPTQRPRRFMVGDGERLLPLGTGGAICNYREDIRPIWDTVVVESETPPSVLEFFVGACSEGPHDAGDLSGYFGAYKLVPAGSHGRLLTLTFFLDDKPLLVDGVVTFWKSDNARFRAPLWLMRVDGDNAFGALARVPISSEDLCKVELRFRGRGRFAHKPGSHYRCAATILHTVQIER